jgi:hypothetical protein
MDDQGELDSVMRIENVTPAEVSGAIWRLGRGTLDEIDARLLALLLLKAAGADTLRDVGP